MIMKKRLVIGKLLKGDKRLDGETFVEYKERMKEMGEEFKKKKYG